MASGRLEPITHIEAIGHAEQQHLHLVALLFHSPGQT